MHEQLKSKLAQLKQTLGDIQELDAESRELLQQLDRDIQLALEGGTPDAGVSHRLEQQAVEFDSQYPSASAVIRDIIDVLGKMGI
ncbi:MAG: DUF4404 family protein [Gammaproteobacteria bacterium]|nr:DUF4404 family protein [Gammaproteobacteria bacterium]